MIIKAKETKSLTGQGKSQKKIYISNLINSFLYSLPCAFIMAVNGKYRLMALKNNKVVADKLYNTIKGARSAFQKLFKEHSWRENVTPEWSHFYDPEKEWLDEKLSYVNESSKKQTMDSLTVLTN
jgi:hypothetical protein